MAEQTYKSLEEFGQYICLHFAKQDITECCVVNDMLTLRVLRAAVSRVMTFLRDDPACRFSQLTDVCCVDYPDRPDCFTIVYHLLSPLTSRRVRIKLTTEEDVAVSSVSGVFENAVWYEREIREMFGVSFEGHPDLRRLLTEDGAVIHPLRKSFPVAGQSRTVYDTGKERCVSVPFSDETFVCFDGVDLSRSAAES